MHGAAPRAFALRGCVLCRLAEEEPVPDAFMEG